MLFFASEKGANMAKRIALTNSKITTLEDAFNEFMNHCMAKGLAKPTLKYYRKNMEYFFEVVEQDTLCTEMGKETIEDYTLYLQSKDYSKNSVRTMVRALRVFMYFCMEREYIRDFKIVLPKEEEVVKETYTHDEIARLLKKPKKNIFGEYRSYTAIALMLGTGARINTVINIKIEDLDFDNNCIFFKTTKNKKVQVMPMSATLKEILNTYLKLWSNEQEDYLFCNAYKQRMTADGFKHEIAKYNRARGVSKTSCHLFRHTFSKHYVMAGGDIFRLQKLLGHSTLDMVKKYVNMYGNDLSDGFEQYSALEQFSKKRARVKV